MKLSKFERKVMIILAVFMVKMAIAYILIIDQLVLGEYGLVWNALTHTQLIWVLSPVVGLLMYAGLLVKLWWTGDSSYFTIIHHHISAYSGTKFPFL